MNIMISVIIPVYNVPQKYLRQCFESLMEQNVDSVEFIVVDDGSNEETANFCDAFLKEDKRFRVIHQKNTGLSGARNTGFESVRGEWFTFLDGDDYFEKNTIKNLLKSINDSVDIVCFGTIKKFNHYSFKYDYNNKFENLGIYDSEYMILNVLDFKSQIGDATAKLIRTSFAKEYDIIHDVELRQGIEGLDYCFRLFQKSNKTLFIKEYYYNYIYNNESITMSDTHKAQKYIFYGFEKIKKIITEGEFKDNILKMYYKRILYIIVGAAISVYFSPNNKKEYCFKINQFKDYLSNDLIADALKNASLNDLDFKRKIIIILIKYNIFYPLVILGKIRKIQKEF